MIRMAKARNKNKYISTGQFKATDLAKQNMYVTINFQ